MSNDPTHGRHPFESTSAPRLSGDIASNFGSAVSAPERKPIRCFLRLHSWSGAFIGLVSPGQWQRCVRCGERRPA